MSYLDCADEVISSLMDLLSFALASYHPKLGPEAGDMESLYAALCIWRPQRIELETFDGLIKMKRGQIEEAIASLRQVLEKRDFTYAKTMLAHCLFLKGDASWHGLADEVIEKDRSAETVTMIQAMKRYDAFRKGVLSQEEVEKMVAANENAQQVVPGHSVGNLTGEAAQAASAQEAANAEQQAPIQSAQPAPYLPEQHALRL